MRGALHSAPVDQPVVVDRVLRAEHVEAVDRVGGQGAGDARHGGDGLHHQRLRRRAPVGIRAQLDALQTKQQRSRSGQSDNGGVRVGGQREGTVAA